MSPNTDTLVFPEGTQKPDSQPSSRSDEFIPINRIIYGEPERRAVNDVFDRGWFGPGEYARLFTEAVASFVRSSYVQLTNSGSSALLLAVQSMLHLGIWKPGDFIIHPVCTFPTSLNPLLQSGLHPILVDVELDTCNLDPESLETALDRMSIKPGGALIPHLLGNATDMERVKGLLGDDSPIIEDSCDTLGTNIMGRVAGSLGIIGCYSFYGSHHISSGGVGGALATNQLEIFDVVNSMTHWGRTDFWNESDDYERFKQRYTYDTIGYDFQMSEFQAAFGLAQMGRLYDFNAARRSQYDRHLTFFDEYGRGFFVRPKVYKSVNPSWFAYPCILSEDAPFDREALVRHLMENEIETRPLFVGNILHHPAYQRPEWGTRIRVPVMTKNADYLLDHGLFIPSWGMPKTMSTRLHEALYNFLKRY